jgi:hypothetical protein
MYPKSSECGGMKKSTVYNFKPNEIIIIKIRKNIILDPDN